MEAGPAGHPGGVRWDVTDGAFVAARPERGVGG